MADGHLYFHAACFDGMVSAVLAGDFLEARRGWRPPSVHAVGYDRRATWLDDPLDGPAAVVDFLYHPAARFWADHHQTAFLTDAARRDFEARGGEDLVYDAAAGSCAMLLWEHLAKAFGHRNPAYADLVGWADRIDSARYVSVAEAMDASEPALALNLSLAVAGGDDHSEALVRALRRQALAAVTARPEVRGRVERARALAETGLRRFEAGARLEPDGIVLFDVDGEGALVNRYAPYHFFPGARYSAGIVRSSAGARITAMRNPWREFPSVPLGRIAEALGGGGHPRVASIALAADAAAGAAGVLAALVREIRGRETSR